VPEIPLYQLLDDAARRYPGQTALRLVLKYLKFGLAVETTLTYAAVKEAADRFAAALHGLGIAPGDRVAIMLPNLPQYAIAYFGILKAGGIVVNTNPTYTPRELQHQLHDSGAKLLITLTGLYSRIATIRSQIEVEQVILTDVVDSLPWLWKKLAARQVRASGMMVTVPPAPNVHDFYTLIRNAPARPPQVPFQPDDVALLQYSGGTTGTPKGVMLTHRTVMANIKQTRAWLTDVVEGQDTMLGALPFFHVYGMTTTLLLTPFFGGELIMIPDPRQVELVLQIITRRRVSFYPGVPAMYVALLNHPKIDQYNLRSIKTCFSAGAALPLEVARRFEKLSGGSLIEGYGLSETSPLAVANPVHTDKRRAGSIGVPVPSTRVEIVALQPDDEGNFAQMPLGEPGEIVIYGPQVMKGYWNNPEETAKVINARGGLHTGDIAHMDDDGYIYIVDRKKDLIIASGYNVVPREVEEVLFMHPKVMEAVVAGVPDARRGETVKAYVVLKPGETATVEELRAFCKENLAPYKVPTQVDFRKELPKSLVGKVIRRLLVEEELAKSAAQAEPAPTPVAEKSTS
jgi:long-chain acyl-CoA synthetase